MDLPDNVSTGTVTGRYIVKVADGLDPNQEPDALPVTGRIVFTASVPYLPDPTAAPDPVTIMTAPIVGVLDDEGYLCTPFAGTVEPAYRGLKLAATDDPDLSVQDWTWDVTYIFEPVNGHKLGIPAHGFALPSGEAIDLTKVAKVPSSPGYSLPQAEAAVLRAEAIAQSIRDDADAGLFNGEAATLEVGTVTSGTTAEVVNVGDEQHAILNITLEKGDKGDTGDGIPAGGTALQVIRKTTDGATTEWADVDKNLVGLSNVDNTADVDKPVSLAVQQALDASLPSVNVSNYESAQAAIDNYFGLAVRFTPGAYELPRLTLRSNSKIIIDHGATLLHLGVGELFSASGAESTTKTLLSAEGVLQGSKTIVAPGHGLSPGDTFRLASAKMFDERSTNSRHGELLVVDSVNGDTINTVTAIAGSGYGAGNSSYVSKVEMIENITISGGGTILGVKTPALGQFGVKVSLGRGIRVEGVMFKDLDRRHVWFADCIDAWANWNRFDWAVDDLQAYGVVFSDASQDSGALWNVYNGLRHAFTTSNTGAVDGIPRRILFAYNTVNQTSTALGGSQAGGDAIDTHTAAEDIWIENNTVNGSLGAGINFEAPSGRIIGNFVTDTVANGIYVHNESDQHGTITVTQNEVRRAGGYGIYARTGGRGTTQQYEHLNVSYNLVTRATGSGIVVGNVSSTPTTPPEEGVMVVGNTLHRIIGTYALAIGNCADFVQRDNRAIQGTTNMRFPAPVGGGGGDHPGFLFQEIASDSVSVTPAVRYLRVETEASAALDSLTTIDGGSRGQIITITTSSNGRDVEIGTTGNIRILSPLTLALARSSITLGFDGTDWREQSRADFGS